MHRFVNRLCILLPVAGLALGLPVSGLVLSLGGVSATASQASPGVPSFCRDTSLLPRTPDAAARWLLQCPRNQRSGAASQ